MNWRSIFFFFMVVGVTGCSRKVAPVSSISNTTAKTDSIASITKNDSSSHVHIETVTEKKIPAASVDQSFRPSQFDSLIAALKSMPANTPIIYQDKKVQAQLKIMMDSIGNLHFKCTSSEKSYFEKNITQATYIKKLESELSKKNELLSTYQKTEVKEVKSWWATLTENLLARALLYFILAGLTLVVGRTVLKSIPGIKKFIP